MYIQVDEGEVEITLRGKPEDFADLYRELHTWTPAGGWSTAAEQLFYHLRHAGRTDLRDTD